MRMSPLPALMFCATVLMAQNPTGEIRLEIRDPAGAGVEATGRMENRATGLERRFRSDAQGVATVASLPLGRYRLQVSRRGFAVHSEELEVQTASPVSRTITLTLAASSYSIGVVASTPLPGVNLALEEIAAPVQVASHADIDNSGALDLTDFVNRRLDGVYLNEIQGNPAQADLNYRGYTASPLLGTPQGVSVYMDGVRLNQPFGDVVSWDLIPRAAIAEVTLIPGSNPLFGLNTLGGALSLETRDGRGSPGTAVELSGGSFGRKIASLEHGGSNNKGISWFLAGNMFFEDGWRKDSPSNVRQYFGKLNWQGTKTTLALTVAWANNHLTGNGLQEQKFVEQDYASVYTRPDITSIRSPFLNLTYRHNPSASFTLAGNAYYRHIGTRTLNGDLNEGSLDQSVYQPNAADITALIRAGYSGFPTSGANASNTPFPFWRCIAQALQQDEPGEKCNGLLNRTNASQHNGGAAMQLSWFRSPAAGRNQFTAGAAWDQSSTGFAQSQQFAYLNPDRTFTGVNAFADGKNNVNGVPNDTRVDLDGNVHTGSVFATNSLSAGRWHLTGSGRFNRTVIGNRDQLRPVAGTGSLTSANTFDRLNPGAGLSVQLSERVNAYVGYSEGSRAPTSIELGCADANLPCKLPNALAGDPPLKQVVTRTVEAGIRGGIGRNMRWSSGFFRAQNNNDLLFVASTQTGFGYFRNFGQTLRSGVETSLNGHWRKLVGGGGYTFLDATYQSAETVRGSSNSSNDSAAEVKGLEGTIRIAAGSRIPLTPQQMVKAWADVNVTSRLVVNLNLVAISSSFASGNENNSHRADGTYYLGPGTAPGYGVVNLAARYRLNKSAELFVRVNNLFDHHYYTAAQLQVTGFTSAGNFRARPLPAVNGDYPLVHATFFAPGAPIGVFGGVRIKF